jgi:outer membrane lipoprotein-sorting protein
MARDTLWQRQLSVASIIGTLTGVSMAFALIADPVAAQDRKPAQNSAGAPGWNTQTAAESGVTGIVLEPRQVEIVQLVSGYFNSIEDMRGAFVQTTSDNKRMRGKFFMKKPGRIRFEYSSPSRQLIISDGHQIAIQDLDINTDDRVMVDQTPFRVLLKKDVDLLRDARILDVQEADDLLIVALQDKAKDASGKVRLFLIKTPALELKEWVTTDAQGIDTRLEVSGLDKSQAVDAAMFKITTPTFNKLQ